MNSIIAAAASSLLLFGGLAAQESASHRVVEALSGCLSEGGRLDEKVCATWSTPDLFNETDRSRVVLRVLPAAAAGSLVGSLAGGLVAVGVHEVMKQNIDADVSNVSVVIAVASIVLGATAGAATGAYIAYSEPGFRRALVAATLGIGPGVIGAQIVRRLDDRMLPHTGFAVGQAATVVIVYARYRP
jgi:hypothetical protein